MLAKPRRIENQAHPLRVDSRPAFWTQQSAQRSQRSVPERRDGISLRIVEYGAGQVRRVCIWRLAPNMIFPRAKGLSAGCCICRLPADWSHSTEDEAC